MNPFDLNNMGSFLGGFQQRMAEMKSRAEQTEVEGTAGGGKVRVRVTCSYECTGIDIDPSLAEDVDILEDLMRRQPTKHFEKRVKKRNLQWVNSLPAFPFLQG